MPDITVQVFLAAYSHSFNVSISSNSTIYDFKQAVAGVCPGSPETSGQRIIHKGRLLADAEIIGSIWKDADGPHVCHLAVHPSAWRGEPPSSTTPKSLDSSSSIDISPPPPLSDVPAVSFSSPVLPPSYMPSYPQTTYPYIQYMHTNALRILARQSRVSWPSEYGDIDTARLVTRRGIEVAHRGWPAFLNADFPASTPEDETQGVRYRYTCIDNLPYLSIVNGDDIPTPLQNHAIKVLSYTFPLLCVYSPVQTQQYSNPIQVNPPSRVLAPLPVQPQAPPVARAAIPIRTLILPFLMLTIRTAFLVYFFQPARKPIFGLLVFVWLTWEVMNVLREALRGLHPERNVAANNDNLRGLNQPGNQANLVFGNRDNTLLGDTQETLLNHLAHLNLIVEDRFVRPNATPNPLTPPPTIFYRVRTFVALLFLTAYPGLWDRRRTALRAREIAVRNDANAREALASRRMEREENLRRGLPVEDEPENPQDQQPSTPKPYWVAEYIRRVRSGDWVDDT